MVKVNVKWNKNKYPVDVDEMDLETFQAQLFALTGVPPDRQKILVKGKVLKDNAAMEASLKKDGIKVMLMGTADALPTGPTTKVVFEEDLTANEKKVLTGAIGGGLHNMGNTCYLNSTLQCLRSIGPLKEAIQRFGREPIAGDRDHMLTRNMGRLMTSMDASADAVLPAEFVQMFWQCLPQFFAKDAQGHPMQQDADECLTELFSAMKTKLTSGSKTGNTVDDLFAGKVTITTKCTEEGGEAPLTVVEPFRKLRCHIDSSINFMVQGMKMSMDQKLEKRSALLGRDAVFEEKQLLSELPRFLQVQFVRFSWRKDTNKRAKICKKVACPMVFDVTDLCDSDLKSSLCASRRLVLEEEARKLGLEALELGKKKKKKKKGAKSLITLTAEEKARKKAAEAAAASGVDSDSVMKAAPHPITSGKYELMALVTHKGRSAEGGHYVGWCKSNDGKWTKYDDDKVTLVEEADIKKLDGHGGVDWHLTYMCFYKRKDDMPALLESLATSTSTAETAK